MNRFLTLTVITLLLCGCNKVNLEIDCESVIGDYDWVYSDGGVANYITFDEGTDRFGIRLKQKRKLITFKNGQVLEEYKITAVKKQNDVFTLNAESKKSVIIVVINGEELVSSHFPYWGYQNYLKKKS